MYVKSMSTHQGLGLQVLTQTHSHIGVSSGHERTREMLLPGTVPQATMTEALAMLQL